MNKLYIQPKEPPVELLVTLQNETRRKAATMPKNTSLLIDELRDPDKLDSIPTSTAGVVPNGLPDSRGFLQTETAAQLAQKGVIGEDALDIWNKSRQQDGSLAADRQAVLAAPLEVEEPDHWGTSSQRGHPPLLPSVQKDALGTLQFTDGQSRGRGTLRVENPLVDAMKEMTQRGQPGGAGGYGSSLQGPALEATNKFKTAADFKREFAERDAAMRDVNHLKESLAEERQVGVELSMNGHTGRIDRGAIPKPREQKAFINMGTSAKAYGNFDRAFYQDADLFPSTQLSPDEEAAVMKRKNREAGRCEGEFATTNSVMLRDRHEEADVDMSHRRPHYFEKKNGTMQMPRRGDNPTKHPNNHEPPMAAANLVPESYTTTSESMSAYFRHAAPKAPQDVLLRERGAMG